MTDTPIQKRWVYSSRKKREGQLLARYESTICGETVTIPLKEMHNQLWGFMYDGGTLHPWVKVILYYLTGGRRGGVELDSFGILEHEFLRHDFRWAERVALGTNFFVSNFQLMIESYVKLATVYSKQKSAWTALLLFIGTTCFGWMLWIKRKVGEDFDSHLRYHYAPVPKEFYG